MEPYQQGDVVLVNQMNAIENRHAVGKARPAILIDEDHGHWNVVCLTRNSRYMDGTPRIAIPSPFEIGLKGPGYFWSSRLYRISKHDLLQQIGRLDRTTAKLVIQQVRLTAHQAALLSPLVDT